MSSIRDPQGTAYLSAQGIMNYPFPYKLWMAIHLDYAYYSFLKWNRDGTVILLDMVLLDKYLNSSISIFKIKNVSVFLQHLQQFKFEQLSTNAERGEAVVLQYRHEYFRRHRIDLLPQIRRTEPLSSNDSAVSGSSNAGSSLNPDRHGDLCYMVHGSMSNMNKARIRFENVLRFQQEKCILERKLIECNVNVTAAAKQLQSQPQPQQCSIKVEIMATEPNILDQTAVTSIVEELRIIDLQPDMLENPYDSVMPSHNCSQSKYAGFYGGSTKELVEGFFQNYLPEYDEITRKMKKIEPIFFAIPKADPGQNFRLQNAYSPNPYDSGPDAEPNLPDMSSGLEPLFEVSVPELLPQAEEQQHTNDADICMEELIRFKMTEPDAGGEMAPDTDDVLFDLSPSTQAMAKSVRVAEPEAAMVVDPTEVGTIAQSDDDRMVTTDETNLQYFIRDYHDALKLIYDRV